MAKMTVSAKIREIRKSKGLTLEELSAACGLSVSQLSKIETGKARLTFDTALILSGLLKVPVTAFLSNPPQSAIARRSVTPAGGGIVHQTPGMRFEVLCSDFKEKRNVFWRVVINATTVEASGGWRSHPGEEFLHVLQGTLELQTEHYEPARLNTGDSILFDASMPHAYVAIGGREAIVLMSNTVPADGGPGISIKRN